jgi:hypothetical protein
MCVCVHSKKKYGFINSILKIWLRNFKIKYLEIFLNYFKYHFKSLCFKISKYPNACNVIFYIFSGSVFLVFLCYILYQNGKHFQELPWNFLGISLEFQQPASVSGSDWLLSLRKAWALDPSPQFGSCVNTVHCVKDYNETIKDTYGWTHTSGQSSHSKSQSEKHNMEE